MTALHRKLFRDLWNMKGQALAIAMVISSGLATLVMSLSTLDSLRTTRTLYYRDQRFAEVFASLKRAPESLAERVREIPGVQQVQTRVVAAVNLDLEGYEEPVTGKLVSLDREGGPVLNDLYVRLGRLPEPGRDDEVAVAEAFAEAHGLLPGDGLSAVINGRREELRVVGVVLSPEYIYQIAPGDVFPDFERYGVLWMGREPLASAYDMDGAFNDVALTVSPEASADDVIERLDLLLEPYGGLGAYGRDLQVSHRYLSEEFRQLQQMAQIFPTIFLAVAAFLLNVVVGRLIRTQREQVATLKAFGYRNLDITVHFLQLVGLIVLLGTVGGLILGAWLGRGLSSVYMDFYKFPYLRYDLDLRVVLIGIGVSFGAAFAGTLYSVRRAARQPPAEAMRPEPPASFRVALVERLGLRRWLAQPTRMILRNLERRPVKSLLAVTGIAFACGILMIGMLFNDAIDYMIEVQFGFAQREDLSVSFVEPTSYRALFELEAVEGVTYAEPFRVVPARLRNGHRSYRTAVQGVESGGDLVRLLDADLDAFELPPDGVVLTDYLGELLGVGPGDSLTVEVLEGSRPVLELPVAFLVREYIGVAAYMRLDALNRRMREGAAISGAYLATDPRLEGEIYDVLDEMPRVAGITARQRAIESFYETSGDMMLTFAFFNIMLASSIAFSVVYNSARITLSERSRELASLRVLGFRRAEVSYILLGELALLTLLAIPLGFAVGWGLCLYMVAGLENDLFRIPLVVEPSTYAFSAAVIVVSAVVSGLAVRRRIDRLDLVEVLKTRE